MQSPILITGATGGIGSALCHHLATSGYQLVLTSRSEDKLRNLAAKLGASVLDTVVADFSSRQSLNDLGRRLSSKFDSLSGLVLMPPKAQPTTEVLPTNGVWLELFETSFLGPCHLIKVCKGLLENGSPSKVVIVSGITSVQVLSHYASSNVLRTMWVGQAKTLAAAFGPVGIRVNTISFGAVLTPRYRARMKRKAAERGRSLEDQMTDEVSNVPLGQYASPLQAAQAIEGLLGPFSDHITGVNITCDGGFTRAY